MPIINKLFGKKSKPSLSAPVLGKEENKKSEALVLDKKIKSTILVSSFTTEKALLGQSLNQYTFKVLPSANKIDIAKEVKRTYNVKAVSVNIINIPKKAKHVGRNLGFKAGYKKAIVTLAKGQTIEIK